jgi:hypothetical protein
MRRVRVVNRDPSKVLAAGVAGGVIGALGGAAIAGSVDGFGWGLGAAIGAVAVGALGAWADANRVPGQPQPLFVRIVMAAFIAAPFGAVLEWILPDWSAAVPCAVAGVITGLIGFRPQKVLLGLVVGLAIGFGFDAAWPDVGWALPTAVTVVVYRSLAAIAWKGRDQIQIMGEHVPQERLRYVVPFSEASTYVGVDYLERYAGTVGAAFAHSPPDIGIVADFDELAGPTFDPSRVDGLVREFYEHTSRFKLTIVPEWKRRMRIPYKVYRATVAKPIGQANAPFDQEEVQEGIVSWIDTIDINNDGVADFRAWVRAYETGEPLYVGIYTVQHIEDTAYVSVGFPLPSGNFTATLRPANHRDSGLLLSSDNDSPYSGHYVSSVEEGGELTTLQLASFGEEIDVFVDHGELKTEHRFYLRGSVFMTLHYEIVRK